MFWYIGLSILSIAFIVYTLWKFKDPRLFVFYLAIAGIIYPLETAIFVYFKSYFYEVGVFKNIYKDSVVGHFASNLLAVPAVSLWIAANQLKFRWSIFFSFIFMGIELVFLNLHIYHQIWWKPYYTGLLLPIHFWIAKRLWHHITNNKMTKRFSFLLLSFSAVSISSVLSFFLLGAPGFIKFSIGLFSNSFRDHLAASVPTLFITSFGMSLFITKIHSRIKYLFILVFVGVVEGLLIKYHILTVKSLVVFMIFIVVHLITAYILNVFQTLLYNRSISLK